LAGALLVDTRSARLLHPHSTAAGAAAERIPAVAFHLLELEPRHRRQGVARRGLDSVVAREVARIVIGHLAGNRAVFTDPQPAGGQQSIQVYGVMNDLERTTQLAIFVADDVEAMRACGHDRALVHAVAVQRFDVARCEDLIDVVVAHASSRIAGARLLLTEDGEAHT